MTYTANIIILIVLVILSAYFSSAETALTTVNRIKLKTMVEEKNDKRAALVLKITDNKRKMISAILIGNNIVNLSASSLATSMAIAFFGNFGVGIATGIMTLIILILGEIIPKNFAALHSLSLSRFYAKSIYLIMKILTPFIFIINVISIFIMRIFGVSLKDVNEILSTEEIRTLVDFSEEKGVIEENEKTFINNIFDFSDSMVKEIMVPRIDIKSVDVNSSYNKLITFYNQERKTRFPVYEGEKDNIIGIINMKDLIEVNDDDDKFSIRKFLREPFYTYERKNTADLFAQMQQKSIPMALILDEYGELSGLVTLEDLLEELVGEIRDEYDSDEEDDLTQISNCEFLAKGSINLDDLNNLLPLNFESEDYDTLGGYLTGLFDHFPKTGETYVTGSGIILSVSKIKRKRIIKVLIKFPSPINLPDENKDNQDEKQINKEN